MVLEEEDDSDETMAEEEEGGDEGICIDGEDTPPDNLRYNGEGKESRCINREQAEKKFEASNFNISKVRSKSCNTIARSKTQAKSIKLSRTTHPQLRALNLRHELNVHSQSCAYRRKKC